LKKIRKELFKNALELLKIAKFEYMDVIAKPDKPEDGDEIIESRKTGK